MTVMCSLSLEQSCTHFLAKLMVSSLVKKLPTLQCKSLKADLFIVQCCSSCKLVFKSNALKDSFDGKN
jgi:hypothetical protein